jgi:beta-lactamase class A
LKSSKIISIALILTGLFVTVRLATPSLLWAANNALSQKVVELEKQLNARIGVVVLGEASDQRWQYRPNERFPLNSTFKTLACAALLKRVDEGHVGLDQVVTFSSEDLVAYSPVTSQLVGGSDMTLDQICLAAMTMSDNTAANLVLKSIGGPAGLNDFLRSIGDQVTRLDRWETDLNSTIPGDERDTSTPYAMAQTLRKLILGEIISTSSTIKLKRWLTMNTTAGMLLRPSLPQGWIMGDRTGAGDYGSRSITAAVWLPQYSPLMVTIYVTETEATFEEQNAAIAEIGEVIFATLVACISGEDQMCGLWGE